MMSPPPLTSNTLSPRERSTLIRSYRKLSKVLGDVPRVLDEEIPPLPSASESVWHKRKPTHLPPLLKRSSPSAGALDSPPVYHCPPSHRKMVLSVVSNTPSSASDIFCDSAIQHARLGDQVPATAVFSTTPRTAVPATPPRHAAHHGRTRSVARLADDARSVTFSISSDESVHAVSFTASRMHSPHPHKTKHVYQTGALPPVPSIPAHFASGCAADAGAGLIRPRQKTGVGSKIGGSDFKAARRAKREGKTQNGTVEPGELVEMVGFMF